MLDSLFGSRNTQRILLFLFVNGKCYGSQLSRLLQMPLTPLQNALQRLEEGGVVMSYYEGKTRLYTFDPGFPLLVELEQLLKKAYNLLSPLEKRAYYVVKERIHLPTRGKERQREVLSAFWNLLPTVTQLHVHAMSKGQGEKGWSGRGEAEVETKKEGANTLLFFEQGIWEGQEGEGLRFRNAYRWTLDRDAVVISLEHLRQGPHHPVFLSHLAPSGKNALSSMDSHLCDQDSYYGQVKFHSDGFTIQWRVIGPRKNEEIASRYSLEQASTC